MLTFLTGNTNKLHEAQAILGDNLQQLDIDLPEIQSLNPLEIIQHKIDTALQHFKNITPWQGKESTYGREFFVEDTSLVFHVLGEFPWPLIKWVLKHEWALGAYRLLADYEDKSATATCHIGYRDGQQTHFVSWSIDGTIVAPQGETTFGRDSIFAPIRKQKLSHWQRGNSKKEKLLTFAQMAPSQKNTISHRSQALQKLKKAQEQKNNHLH